MDKQTFDDMVSADGSGLSDGFVSPGVEQRFEPLIAELESLRENIAESWYGVQDGYLNLAPANRASARNLVQYLGLRRHDIRALQKDLAGNGISSLGRSESHLMSNLNKVIDLLHRLAGDETIPGFQHETSLSLDEGTDILKRNTDALLGPQPAHRKVRIMVTLPSEAAENYKLVYDLIACGMDLARVNCAHDNAEIWQRMVDNIRKANSELNADCQICCDIPGPKLRTGQFEPGPQLVKWRLERDVFGRTVRPAVIWCTPEDLPPSPPSPFVRIALPGSFIQNLQVGDKLKFIDARGRRRSLRVIDKEQGGVWLEAKKKAYVVPGTIFRIRHPKKRIAPTEAVLGAQPPLEQYAMLRTGDVLILTRSQRPGRPAITGPNGEVRRPPIVPCTLPAIFDQVKAGEKIWFDDGKLAGIITRVTTDEMEVEITQAGPRGHRLGADKGINLPDSELDLPALTDADREILRFAVQHADLIGYSFVRRAADVRELQRELRQLGRPQLGIILKIETRAAFDNLPELLLAAMENPSSGVMIARGDLAIEVGFERLAEIQEEILWMCEAAHMPVIWATQVLEQLSKKGVCSRAEITDAAMSERAECVMLNKGPFVLDAVKTLDSVLQRMQSHQAKKRAMLRPLKLAERFFTKNSLDH